MKKNYLLLFLFALLLTNSYGQDLGCVRVNANTPLPICNVGDSRTITASPPINSIPRQTSTYNISQTPFVWRSPDNINDITSITSDDKWSGIIPLRGKQTVPFNFCFFGQKYSDCLIGDNGVVTFSILGHPDSPTGLYRPSVQVPAESGSGWAFNATIPSGPGYGPPYKNAIMMLQDLNIANGPTSTSTINYFTVGTYPCRAFVANWQDVPHFSCNPTVQGYQSYQIVLFESTNIIEIHVRKRTSCGGWNGGNGLLGIQNADGSTAYSPTSPNRNTGTWQVPETQSEAWRFSPSGPMVPVTYEWYEASNPGTIIGTGQTVTVSPAVSTTYCVKATFGSCSPAIPPITATDCTIVKVGEPVGYPPKNIKHCTTDTNPRIFDLAINTDVVLGTTVPGPPDNLNPYDFDINYYETLADANLDANPINTAFYDPADTDAPVLYTLPAPDMTKTVYVKILDIISNCSYILPFDLILRDCDAEQIAPIIMCDISNDSQENFNLNDELPAINAAIAAETGNPLPADFSITFHESEADADDVSTALTPAEVISYPGTTGDRVYVRAESIADPTFYYVYYFDLRLVPTPTATISGTAQICENSTATITITGTAGATVRYTDHTGATITVVLVDDGTGTNTGVYTFATPAVVAANSPYVYTLVDASLTTAGITCIQPLTGSATVTVGGLPTASITTADTSICEGSGLTIDVQGTPGTTVTFTDPNGVTQILPLDPTTGNATITVPNTLTPGTYTYTLVKVSTTSTPPCEQNVTDSVIITVRPMPTATIHQVDAQVCLGNPSRVILRGEPNATVFYLLDGNADNKTLDTTGEYVILEVLPTAGTHTYTLVGVRSGVAPMCTQPATGTVSIEVTNAPTATISTSTPVICENGTGTVTITGTLNSQV
ncbi:hypothetical protein FJA49_00535, partial [Flavobacterium microcysteis]